MEQRVTPYLLYEDGAAAIEFLTKAFGFREESRATGAAGGLHAELEVAPGGGLVYLGQPPTGFRNAAADWLVRAFGFEEIERFEEDGEVGHVTLRAGDGLVFLGHPDGYVNPLHLREQSEAAARMYDVPWIVDGVWLAVDDIDALAEQA